MRLFVAIELTDEVREALTEVQSALGRTAEGVRWVRAEQLHLTVKFLGETPDAEVARAAEAVARSAARAKPFEMGLTDSGCFPPRGPVRIVWAGMHDPSGSLLECVNAVEEEMEGIGFPRESRPFSPHITIGRAREGRSSDGTRSAVEGVKMERVGQLVNELTLMSSVLSPKGPSYSVVSRARLGAAANPPSGRC